MRTQAILATAALMCAHSAPAVEAEPRIPFVEGLTTVSVSTSPIGDHENLRVISSIKDTSYRVVVSGDVPVESDDGFMDANVPRVVRFKDQLHSRNMRVAWHTWDRESMAGNVPGISCDVFHELRRLGAADLALLDLVVTAGFPTTIQYKGRVKVVDRSPAPLLVNRVSRALPALHATGTLTDAGGKRRELEFTVLDDPDNPLLLQVRFGNARGRVIRIEYPLPTTVMERALAGAAPVELSGVHFAFASPVLRPESDAVLSQLAAVLVAHPDWRFRVEGHTDSIGEGEANLQLSHRRAAAVQAALTGRFGVRAEQLTIKGLGESRPLADNDSETGRARNRRVELVRLGPPARAAAQVESNREARAGAVPTACPNPNS
jgi:outer membrane protein OmpA-like peptidoglycan-associated protein